MKVEFSVNALKKFQAIKSIDAQKAEKVKGIIKDILLHPEAGLGEPTALDGKLKGLWQRKISYNEFIYYFFNEDTLIVAAIKVNLNEEVPNINQSFQLDEFSKEDYASVMALMAANRGKDSEPKVGIRRI